MSTVHRRDIEQEFAQAHRLVKAAIRQLRQRSDPRLRAEQSQVTSQILETFKWMRRSLSKLIHMPRATSKEQITLLYHVLDKVLYAWTASNNALEGFGLDEVEGPVDG
jgi:hypothetical protein